ncbi:hypothetical protein CC1G_01260 [Coprinopsis cinerea okayama7|uniref:Major facilitator superfamily (MFS) profile domain-containing protein n=1 Tax=Coprinopsis cinerea (strain Okayama-7 / 130 / ATCC MYA-4618 / FGSC 9003) TaxID=240176 RepID=A8NY56_COPC7|nr:hypothetical protein CC1G_01260 [Coprinopsis cinerea okayama7\|eukprot:XP_001837348.2 hypothetical protein CC1G_01260 [Coprinopsis cinerea okayama7\
MLVALSLFVSSVAVTDLIPLLYGLGAAIGGPFGGYINDNFGWRVAFYMQVRPSILRPTRPPCEPELQAPFFVFAIAIVAIKVNIPLSEELQNQPLATKNAASSFYLQFPCEYVGIFYAGSTSPPFDWRTLQCPIAIPSGSLFAGCAIVASFLASQWSENTPSWHFWVDLIPSGCGMASLITSTLIAADRRAWSTRADNPVNSRTQASTIINGTTNTRSRTRNRFSE